MLQLKIISRAILAVTPRDAWTRDFLSRELDCTVTDFEVLWKDLRI